MLIDDDNMTNFLNKIIIDNAEIVNTVVRERSAQSGLLYLSDSISTKGYLPFPDIIFIDKQMPLGSGWDFINDLITIKQNFPVQPIIVMLTSHVKAEDISQSSRIKELYGLYSKPLSPEILNSVITKYYLLRSERDINETIM
ncbi:MAG: response regulator [Ferruginibacter sp.]|nr:response regulator [Ferruginibacter sp.]